MGGVPTLALVNRAVDTPGVGHKNVIFWGDGQGLERGGTRQSLAQFAPRLAFIGADKKPGFDL